MTTDITIYSKALLATQLIENNPHLGNDDIEFFNDMIAYCNKLNLVASNNILNYYQEQFNSLLSRITNITQDIDSIGLVQEDTARFTIVINDFNYKQIIFFTILGYFYHITVDYELPIHYNKYKVSPDNIKEFDKILYSNSIIIKFEKGVKFHRNEALNLSNELVKRATNLIVSTDLTLLKGLRSKDYMVTLLYSCLVFGDLTILDSYRDTLVGKIVRNVKLNVKILGLLYTRAIQLKISNDYYFDYFYKAFNITPDEVTCFLHLLCVNNRRETRYTYISYSSILNFVSDDVYKELNFNSLYFLYDRKILPEFILCKPNLFDLVTVGQLRMLKNRDWVDMLLKNHSFARRLLEVKDKTSDIKTMMATFPDIAIYLLK